MKDKEHTSDDHRAIDALIARFFAVFDNRSGQVPELAVLDALFVAGGVIFKRDALGGLTAMDLEAFKTPRLALFASGALRDFHEWETDHQTRVDLGLASRVSRYQKSGWLHDEPCQGQGVKHFQLISTVNGWQIASMVWEDIT